MNNFSCDSKIFDSLKEQLMFPESAYVIYDEVMMCYMCTTITPEMDGIALMVFVKYENADGFGDRKCGEGKYSVKLVDGFDLLCAIGRSIDECEYLALCDDYKNIKYFYLGRDSGVSKTTFSED